jgi:hypothetical protein
MIHVSQNITSEDLGGQKNMGAVALQFVACKSGGLLHGHNVDQTVASKRTVLART